MRDLETVQVGQLVVEDGDLRLVLFDLLQCLSPVLRLGEDFDLTGRQECAYDPFAIERVVVGDDHAHLLVRIGHRVVPS